MVSFHGRLSIEWLIPVHELLLGLVSGDGFPLVGLFDWPWVALGAVGWP